MSDEEGEVSEEVEEVEEQGPAVLEAPVEAAEPLGRLVEGPTCRVIDGSVVERLGRLSNALVRAENRAHATVEKARREAHELRQEAREEGRREGYRELVEVVGQVRRRYRQIQDEAEADTLELAFRVARQLIGREIEREPEVVADMVAESLEHVRGKRQVVVHVHPADRRTLEVHRSALSEQAEGASIYLEEDPSIERGGCVIETEDNRIDARLELQLERLREAITS
jgi:flagellar biosynthesis/type III secretory pathway protein FliH